MGSRWFWKGNRIAERPYNTQQRAEKNNNISVQYSMNKKKSRSINKRTYTHSLCIVSLLTCARILRGVDSSTCQNIRIHTEAHLTTYDWVPSQACWKLLSTQWKIHTNTHGKIAKEKWKLAKGKRTETQHITERNGRKWKIIESCVRRNMKIASFRCKCVDS